MKFDVLAQAIKYYTKTTGKDWTSFYSEINDALNGDLNEQKGSVWYTHILLNTVMKYGFSIDNILINKDTIKKLFDNDSRVSNGEFFTPEIWCKEGRTYFDKHIPNWRTDYYVWDICAGTGNLLRTIESNDRGRLFLSTLQKDDVEVIKGSADFDGANVFQLDFLSTIAYNKVYDNFIELLPKDLQDVLLNDKPLIIYANPPYKAGKNKATEVGRFMGTTRPMVEFDFTDFSAPSYDIFYQFCFQVMCIVMQYKLKNTYFAFFGPLRFFVGSSAGVLLEKFERTFEFLDGMCISASEFNDIGKEVSWGIGCSLWKSYGDLNLDNKNYHKDILLDKKYIDPDGNIMSYGKVLYEPARINITDWIIPKKYEVLKKLPVMTAYHTFKNGEPLEKKAYLTDSVPSGDDYLACLMVQDNLARSSFKSGLLSAPTTIAYAYVMKENFWRVVANFAFRRLATNLDWSMTKKEISAPNENVEGYDKWVKNALAVLMFDYKSMTSSIRNVVNEVTGDVYQIKNAFFYCTPEEVKEHCHDERILKDLELYSNDNAFFLQQLEKAYPDFDEPVKNLFDWVKTFTLSTYDFRKDVNYVASLECWDAGFQQVRRGLMDEQIQEEFSDKYTKVRDYLLKDIFKFGFIKDIEE